MRNLPPLPRPGSFSARDMRDYAKASVKAAVEERSAEYRPCEAAET